MNGILKNSAVLAALFVVTASITWVTIEERRDRAHGQGIELDPVGPVTDITTPEEWDAFRFSILDSNLREEIESFTGELLYLGFARVEGSNDFKGTAVFKNGTTASPGDDGEGEDDEGPVGDTTLDSLAWDFCLDDSTCDYSVAPITAAVNALSPAVVIPAEQYSWDLFFYVLENPPAEIANTLSGLPLVDMWIEGPGVSNDWRCFFLRFGTDSVSKTLRVRANFSFGQPLFVHTLVL